ncbi:hypothetical protein ABEO92_13275 [Geobacillus stearothermophilus]|uniref:hypothetical protein n=1 Tax=Geobacillus stearothermophilus TaxID=1422 RepID=UPI003D1B1E73
MDWTKVIKERIEKINKTTDAINDVLKELKDKQHLDYSVKVVDEEGKIKWIINIDGFKKEFSPSDFSKPIEGSFSDFGDPIEEVSFDKETIIKAIIKKFDWNLN